METSSATLSTTEAAKLLGVKNPETIRKSLRNGLFPIGFAYRSSKEGKWNYVIPKKPFMQFLETGLFTLENTMEHA